MPKPVRILVIEDDPLISKLYGRAFQFLGYDVDLVFDGQEAIKMLDSIEKDGGKKPDIILLDIIMPKLNGFDVLRNIKNRPGLKSIPVVILSNLAGQTDTEKALSLGAVTYLIKSQYEPREVVEKLKEIIAAYTREQNLPEAKVQTKEVISKKKK